MARKPSPPRTIGRSAEPETARVAGPRFRKVDRRQAELFQPPAAFIPPCKPVLRDRLPEGELWQYEVKLDGYRIQAHAVGGDVQLFSKSGRDYTARLSGIVEAVAALACDVILDGEAVMLDANGHPDFFPLHAAIAAGCAPDAILFAFDLLALDGMDLRPHPLLERQEILAGCLAEAGPHLALSEHHVGDGASLLQAACAAGLEGIVAKRCDRPYRSGEGGEWVKVRCTKVEPFAVIGFDPAGRKGVSSLKLARLVDGELIPCGSAGSGIGEALSRELRQALNTGEPVVMNVEHRGLTPAGELRHPVVRERHPQRARHPDLQQKAQGGTTYGG